MLFGCYDLITIKTPENPGDCRITLNYVMTDADGNPHIFTPAGIEGSITLEKS